MNITTLAAEPLLEKNSGLLRNIWRYARRPFFGAERAAAGSQRGVGQMTDKADRWISQQVTKGGLSRDSYNDKMRAWWQKNQALADDYSKAHPKAKDVLAKGDDSLSSHFKQWETGTGAYKGRGTLKSRIDAQKAKDLEASYAGFGSDAKRMADAERVIQAVRAGDMSAMPMAAVGGAGGAYTGYQEGGLQGALAGAAAGATLGYGGGRALASAMRNPNQKAWMDAAKSVQKGITGAHGKGQLGARLNYKARRAADFFLEKGRYANAAERARFGRLGGGHIFGRHGEEVFARAAQGGLLGKGGLIRGALAVDPRIAMNARLARHAFSQGQYGDAARLAGSAALGSGMHAGKLGLMGGFAGYGVYGDMTSEDTEGKSFGQRLGRSLGSNLATMATFPLGMATYVPGMIAGNDNLTLSGQAANLGEAIGGLGSSSPSTTPQAPTRLPPPEIPQNIPRPQSPTYA